MAGGWLGDSCACGGPGDEEGALPATVNSEPAPYTLGCAAVPWFRRSLLEYTMSCVRRCDVHVWESVVCTMMHEFVVAFASGLG
jgi:hypothetical protein